MSTAILIIMGLRSGVDLPASLIVLGLMIDISNFIIGWFVGSKL